MAEWQLQAPVCLIIFKRPDTTEKVFEVIRQVKPSKLLVIADGPRAERLGEAEKCAATRAIIDRVDWKCEVLKNYSDVNLGLKRRVSSGLDWIFNTVEEAIILEDDCLPHPTFFRFCEELLNFYRNDKRVMLIAGTNFQFGLKRTQYSYYFSRYIDCWGWATWKRAWQHYDFEMKSLPEILNNNWLLDILQDPQEAEGWARIFKATYEGQIDSWAYRWKFACWIQSGLTILPNVNLVSNIGFNAEAVHTKDSRSPFANTVVEAMNFPLHHPSFVIRDDQADEFTKQVMFGSNWSMLREKMVEFWENLSQNDLENRYIRGTILGLLNTDIREEDMTDTEKTTVNELTGKIVKAVDDPKVIQYLLAAMLYVYPHQLPLLYDLSCIPEWLLKDYLRFMFTPPRLFKETGEVERYSQYMQKWVNHLHTNIFREPNSKLYQEAALYFTQNADFRVLHFTTANLRELFVKRAEIIEFALQLQGQQVDYDFPERLSVRSQIRLGILVTDLEPQPETFATLPVYKYLNRDVFEIILYSLHGSGHRFERYCSGHADAGVQLPEDLASKVKTIRDDELDILFIASNVTAEINPITLLAVHRLAPIQIVNLNSPVTTGMRHADYYISGKLTERDDNAQQHYTETLITLDGSGLCLDFATEEQRLATISVNREDLDIDQNAVVFISGANLSEITPEVEAAWVKVMASVPNSKLVLYPFNSNSPSSLPVVHFKKRLVAALTSQGLSEEQLTILGPLPNRADIKECLKLADIYLDSYYSSGINALIEPLEIGLPTVVMEGDTSLSRIGASLLRELQVPELITNTENSYIQLAVALGTDPELRKQKRDQIKQNMQRNPRFLDSHAYSVQMGVIFQEIFLKHLADPLSKDLKLRDINLIIFPDWNQSEESLNQDLSNVIKAIATHPDRIRITLVIDTTNISEADAELAISGVVMNLLMEEDLDVADGPEISLIGNLSEMHMKALLLHIQGRIVLENENQQALIQRKAINIPSYELDSFNTKQFLQD
jgi:predicted O-linked N-acetylglucosamine transferase (SPINDLY family)